MVPHPHPQAQAAALNAELLARSREHVALLLGLLEDEPVGVADFYCRYHTVQLLTGLLGHCAGRLQEAILATPMSVVRLTELLGEREVGGVGRVGALRLVGHGSARTGAQLRRALVGAQRVLLLEHVCVRVAMRRAATPVNLAAPCDPPRPASPARPPPAPRVAWQYAINNYQVGNVAVSSLHCSR